MQRAYELPSEGEDAEGPGLADGAGAVHSGETHSGLLDLSTLLKASLAISSEIRLDSLLEKLMRFAIENAGAQRGFLILDQDGVLTIAAEATAEGGGPRALSGAPLEASRGIALTVIDRVMREKKPVVLGNAAKQGPFTADAYVARVQPKSLLCLPILSHGNPVGALYLENNLTADAFTPFRLEILRTLTSEAAISIENARLYANLAMKSAELRESYRQLADYSQTLEERVEERTQALQTKNEELRDALDKLSAAQQQVAQQEKLASLGALTAGVAHEIRNPLNFVNNFAEISVEILSEVVEDLAAARFDGETRERLDENLDSLRQNLDKINQHGRRADGVVNAMLLHARDKLSAQPEATDLNEMLREYTRMAFSQRREGEDAALAVDIRTDLDGRLGVVYAVAQDLSRVFINILDNAYYALRAKAKQRGAAFRPWLKLTTRNLGDRVEVRIRDNGLGIPKDVKAQIFTPFFTTKPAREGTGLGLSVSYFIVTEQHHGTLSVISEPGRGACFVLCLPINRRERPHANVGIDCR